MSVQSEQFERKKPEFTASPSPTATQIERPSVSTLPAPRGYRERIYERYATLMTGSGEHFDNEGADRLWRARQWYLRGWLPVDREAYILDVACGDGKLLYSLRKEGYQHLAGVDVSPQQASLACQTGADVAEGDILSYLDLRPDQFDLISGTDIIEHLSKDEALRFIDACHRALKSGGRLILQTPNADSPLASHLRFADFTHEWCYQPTCLAKLLEFSGFTKVELREAPPVPFGYSLISSMRWLAWQFVRLGVITFNCVETGNTGSGILTRVFLISALK